jgi:hypothetical protein
MPNEIVPVFVDIDGVVNSTRSVFVKIGHSEESTPVKELAASIGELPYGATYALRTVDPVCVGLVNKIFSDILASGTTPEFVLSSTHRKYFSCGAYGTPQHLTRLRAYLTTMGFDVPACFSVTECLHTERGNEVQDWLDRVQTDVDVNNYVILDDGNDFRQGQPLVKVDPTIGFSFENYVDACKFLALAEPSKILF